LCCSRPEETKALAPRRSRAIEIEQFVDLADIDPIVWDAPYYLGPGDDTAAKSYELLRRAMEETGKVGIGRFVMRNKEYLVTVRPLGKGLVIETMHYRTRSAIRRKRSPTCPRGSASTRVSWGWPSAHRGTEHEVGSTVSSEDTFRDRVQELIQKKAKGQKIVAEEPPPETGKGGGSDGGAQGQSGRRRPAAVGHAPLPGASAPQIVAPACARLARRLSARGASRRASTPRAFALPRLTREG
jgi:non-homologous end joining protein Ku